MRSRERSGANDNAAFASIDDRDCLAGRIVSLEECATRYMPAVF